MTVDVQRAAMADPHGEAVIDACRRGERSALERVFRIEAPYLERVLFRILGASSDVEDVLQITLEHAIRAFPSFRGEAGVRTWLTRIAVRNAMHHRRHPAQRHRANLALVDNNDVPDDDEERAGARVEARSSLRLLYEHLANLEPTQRTAFVLYQVEGRSMEEVAALMDAAVSTTKSRVMWARRRLFARLHKDPRARDLLATRHDGDTP